MNPTLTALIVFGCLVGAVLVGRAIRGLLPEAHLAAESKDAVKLAMGLVATMSALVLGLLVSSAKDAYDTATNRGDPDGRQGHFPWPSVGRLRTGSCRCPGAASRHRRAKQFNKCGPVKCAARQIAIPMFTQVIYCMSRCSGLSPQNDMQSALKSQATTLAGDLAQTRSLLAAQSVPSVSQPMLIILVSWLVVIFVGFSVVAPPNATTVLALMVSALAVSGAIFLILELDQPFGGLIGISSEPMLNALHQLAQ